jgi:hypothetical protein
MNCYFEEDRVREERARKIRLVVRSILAVCLLALAFYAGEMRMASLRLDHEQLRPLMTEATPNMRPEARCSLTLRRDQILHQNACLDFGYRWDFIDEKLRVSGYFVCLP